MKKDASDKQKQMDSQREMVDQYYKKMVRIVEYYVLTCFILITFVPLLDFSWVQGATKFIYLTGFPLLILLFLVSLTKEPLLTFLAKKLKS